MSRKIRNGLLVSAIFLFVSAVFTVLITTVDVQSIGINNMDIGFASVNGAVRDALGTSPFLYTVSNLLGYLSILFGIVWMVVALMQWIRRKSIFRVDIYLIVMGFLLVTLGILYILFEKVAINYRPVLMEGEITPEPSFPSSHTLLMTTVFGSCFIIARRMIHREPLCSVYRALCAGLLVIGILTRLLSGVHWLTDIIASILYSGTLISLYYTIPNIILRLKRLQKQQYE